MECPNQAAEKQGFTHLGAVSSWEKAEGALVTALAGLPDPGVVCVPHPTPLEWAARQCSSEDSVMASTVLKAWVRGTYTHTHTHTHAHTHTHTHARARVYTDTSSHGRVHTHADTYCTDSTNITHSYSMYVCTGGYIAHACLYILMMYVVWCVCTCTVHRMSGVCFHLLRLRRWSPCYLKESSVSTSLSKGLSSSWCLCHCTASLPWTVCWYQCVSVCVPWRV